MKKEIVISENNDLAVVFEDNRAAEFIIRSGEQLVGDIILGKVESVVPAIEAAFVNIGHEKNGFIHVADLPIPQRGKKNKAPQIKSGDKLIVQIAKAPTGTKGARLTGRVSVPGRHLVFVPHDNRVCISRRITDSKERERLRRIAFTLKDPGHGLIVRTEAIGATEDELRRDIDELIERWAEILHEAQVRHSPALLYRDQDLLTRVLRDWLTADTQKVILEDQEAFDRSTELLSDWMPDMVKNLHLYRGKDSVMQHYKIHQELETALKPTIRLPSGGSIVIEPTEALTVIDVNSGKLTQSKSLQDTVLRTNLEAATEIARQLRLRDIGGVIIIDFISMDHASDRKRVIAHLEDALKPDKSRPQITSQFSEHGLLEVARRRQGQSLTEQLTKPCPSCHGYGRVRNEVYQAAPSDGTLDLEGPDEPESIVEDLIEEPIAGPDMRDAEPEPGTEGRTAARGRSRRPAVRPISRPGSAIADPGSLGMPPLRGGDDDLEEADELEGGSPDGDGDAERDGSRRRRRRRRRGRGGDRSVAEGSGTVAAVGGRAPYGYDESDETEGDLDGDFEDAEEMRVPAAEEASEFGNGEEREGGPRRRRRRRGGRGRRGEGVGDQDRSALEPAAALAPEAGAARGFARPPREGREPREPRAPYGTPGAVYGYGAAEPAEFGASAYGAAETRDRGDRDRDFGDRGGRGGRGGGGPRDRDREYGSGYGSPVERDYGDRPGRGERPDRGFASRPEREERPDRGDRPERGDRGVGDRGARGRDRDYGYGAGYGTAERDRDYAEGGRSGRDRDYGSAERGAPYGDRPERGERTERGDRADRAYGDRSERGERTERGNRAERGDRTERGFGGRSEHGYGDRPGRGDRDDVAERGFRSRADRGEPAPRPERGYAEPDEVEDFEEVFGERPETADRERTDRDDRDRDRGFGRGRGRGRDRDFNRGGREAEAVAGPSGVEEADDLEIAQHLQDPGDMPETDFGGGRSERGGRDRGFGRGRDRDRGGRGGRDRDRGDRGGRGGRDRYGSGDVADAVSTTAAEPGAPSAGAPAATAPKAAPKLPKGLGQPRPIVGPIQKTAPYQPRIAPARPRMELREVAPGVMQMVPVEDRPAEAPAKAAKATTSKATTSKATTAKAPAKSAPSKAKAEPEATETKKPAKAAVKTTTKAAGKGKAEAVEEVEAEAKPAARKRTPAASTAKTPAARAKKPVAKE